MSDSTTKLKGEYIAVVALRALGSRLRGNEDNFVDNFIVMQRRYESLLEFHDIAKAASGALHSECEQKDTRIAALEAQIAASQEREGRMREALEIIAGRKPCIDSTMSNVAVAMAALAAEKGER